MADTVTPQGFVAVVRQFPVSARRIFEDEPALVVILEEVRDPGQSGHHHPRGRRRGRGRRRADRPHRRPLQPQGGAVDHRLALPSADRRRRRPRGDPSIARPRRGPAGARRRHQGRRPARRAPRRRLAAPTAWVFGNEAHGLPDDKRALADRSVSVPIYGHAESMNLATAASVCLFESAFAQQP